MEKFDLIVLGSGPGGYVAAIRSAQLGLKTALIEPRELGGVCLNWGCIPTKALLKSAEVKHLIDSASSFGIDVQGVTINFEKIIQRSRDISKQLSAGIQGLLKKNKVTILRGYGALETAHIASVSYNAEVKQVEAQHIIIATGARPRLVSPFDQTHERIWTAKTAMMPPFFPKTLLVVGSGAIGMEFASFYHALGTQVHVVEMQKRIFPQEDLEISELAYKAFQKKGMTFSLATTIKALACHSTHISATLQGDSEDQQVTADAILCAIGIVGNIENLGLEKVGVKTEKNTILTNQWGQTNIPSVYAIGDIAGPPWLAHKASHEGIICVEKIAGMPHVEPLDKTSIPGCTYSFPQVASMGLTEEVAREQFQDIYVGKFPFRANGKALTLNEPEGMVKVIFHSQTGELLGAHMIGHEVTELIHSLGIAKSLEATYESLNHIIFPHPTLSEMLHEAVLDAQGRAVHF